MCGIVGILGQSPVAPQMMEALRRLEYRGYDSAGVATLEGGHLTRRRAEGKLSRLADRLAEQAVPAVAVESSHSRTVTALPTFVSPSVNFVSV